ncbi:DUF2057 family protein [Vibrio aestuarianus]|uniref:DUF2057 family protein n=1 Tax=Vibrio aestuarianus TaxID=28171 RepID=UPI00237C5482|nr:DUF2057 family protein [Vibrio aestuarianus]MDE1263274.1 DUF2057 domain-containing protein [Vibrio aestuarianus]MDE1295316.1 DUF2057 domain-containing protein [Vibrio aestuarianus]
MNKVSIIVLSLFLGACGSLDSGSNFADSVLNVQPKGGYIQVTGRSYVAENKANVGADIIKSSLYFTYNKEVTPNQAPESSITMDVSYFQSYKEYETVSFFGKTIELEERQVPRESCSEHCTKTQYIKFPLSDADIQQARENNLEFTLDGQNSVMSTTFIVPKAYIDTIYNGANNHTAMAVAPVVAPATVAVAEKPKASQAQEMVQYWFAEASESEQKAFADWAFANRSSINQALKTESKPLEMLSYWYEKADKSEKSQILSWLLNQQ